MKNSQIMSAMTEMDDDFLLEAAPGACSVAEVKKGRTLRTIKTFVIVICAVLALGGAAYAAGVLTGTVSIYNSAEAEVKARHSYIDGVEVDFIDLDVWVPVVDQKEIKGSIRDVAQNALQELQKMEEGGKIFIDWVKISGNETEGTVSGRNDGDYYQIIGGKSFNDQKKALDYIGFRSFELQYFPYDKYKVSVSFCAEIEKNDSKSELPISLCYYDICSIDEKISVHLHTECPFVDIVPKKAAKCYMGIDSFAADGSAIVETFTNVNGYNGGKGYASESSNDVNEEYFIRGGIVKDNVFYQIDIRCDWADKAEADRIFDTWVNNF